MAVLFLLSGVFSYFYVYGAPSFATLQTTVINGLGDELFAYWVFNQASSNLFHLKSELLFGNAFFPHPSVLAFAEGMWLPSIYYGVLNLIGFNSFLAYHLTILSCLALNWVAMFALCRRFLQPASSILAASVFAFSTVRLAQLTHIQLLPQFFFPLTLIALLNLEQRARVRARVRNGMLLALMISAQFYSSIYLGMILVFSLLPYVGVRLWKKKNRKAFISCCVAVGVLTGMLIVPTVMGYLSVSRTHHLVRALSEAHIYGAHITHFLSAHPASVWGPFTEPLLKAKGQMHEKRLFVGLVALSLSWVAGYLFWKKEKKGDPFWLIVFCVTIAFVIWIAQGPQARLYSVFYYLAPGFKGLRVPARFGFSYLFLISIAAGYGLDFLQRSMKPRALRVSILTALLIFFFWENRIPTFFVPIPKELASSTQILKATPGTGSVVYFPLDTVDTIRMYHSLSHGRRIFNGYSGFIPEPQLTMLLEERNKGPSLAMINEFRKLGLEFAVVEKQMEPRVASQAWYSVLAKYATLIWEDPASALFRL